MDIGKASVKHVEESMLKEFAHLFGDKKGNNIFYILNDVEWYESPSDRTEVFPVLIIEPIYKKTPNNMVCLCTPFNKRFFE
tara:strand:- start:124 stop:366 length:243 start_codon:yes stop_codon:yes gene_type:complete